MDNSPQYSQPDVLRVTRLREAVLQTWINREAIILAEQNPGTGRKRLYSKIDVVKLAVMSRMHDLRVALIISRRVAEAIAAGAEKGIIHWDHHIFLKPHRMQELLRAAKSNEIGISLLQPRIAIARDIRVADYTGAPDARDESQREALARVGRHAEPVIIFPIGEIVNGALAQLRAIDEAAASEQARRKTN